MKEETLKKIIEIISTHEEDEELGYCDTGSDMELSCRSECVDMARSRIIKAYNTGFFND